MMECKQLLLITWQANSDYSALIDLLFVTSDGVMDTETTNAAE